MHSFVNVLILYVVLVVVLEIWIDLCEELVDMAWASEPGAVAAVCKITHDVLMVTREQLFVVSS